MIRVEPGDCLEVMAQLKAEGVTVQAVVCDPPYGLQFMGHEWDRLWRDRNEADQEYVAKTDGQLTSRARKLPDYSATKPAQMQEWHYQWARAAYNLLPPGGHLLAFGGTRTYHRLACAIEDAGFEVRDMVSYLYGSGFPKSHDVSKGIDKARTEDTPRIAAVTAWLARRAATAGITRAQVDEWMGTSDMAGWWLSTLPHRAQVPTMSQWERLRTLIHFGPEMDQEIAELNDRKGQWSDAAKQRGTIKPTGGLHGGTGDTVGKWNGQQLAPDGVREAARGWQGWGTALKPACEPIVLARKPLDGTVAANVLAHGVGGLNVDGCRVEADRPTGWGGAAAGGQTWNDENCGLAKNGAARPVDGRWPANVALSVCEDEYELRPNVTSEQKAKLYRWLSENP